MAGLLTNQVKKTFNQSHQKMTSDEPKLILDSNGIMCSKSYNAGYNHIYQITKTSDGLWSTYIWCPKTKTLSFFNSSADYQKLDHPHWSTCPGCPGTYYTDTSYFIKKRC